MKDRSKLLFAGISAVLIAVGMLAVMTESHTGYSRLVGIRTLLGSEAIWFGRTCLLLAVLPLLVWLPSRWLGAGAVIWWVSFMAWVFGSFML